MCCRHTSQCAGARIASKWRQRYLKAALHQDISHYDTELTSGDVVSGLNADCSAVQNAISEKVSLVIHHMTTVVAALIMAIVRGWKLALVMIALMPLIAVAGAVLAKVVTMGTTKQAEAFAKANGVASQSILNIRTVQSFQAEPGILKRFAGMLDAPRKMAIKLSTFQGGATGFVNAVVFVTCVPSYWFCYLLTVLFSVLITFCVFGALSGTFSHCVQLCTADYPPSVKV